MTKIFISYRRADSQYVTDSIHDYMMREFGTGNVFLDVGSIPFGVDFRSYIAEQIAAHDVVLVVIGPEWGRMMQERAEQENDFVRIEIESALQQNRLVIPVLVMEARMPDFHELPASIGDLQWRNSAVIRRKPDLEHDCQRPAEGIRQYARSAGPAVAPQTGTTGASADAVCTLIGEPFELCEVPAGEFIYGDEREQNGPQSLSLPAFAIAKYPITYSQFQAFIEARDGFGDSRWWQGLAQDGGDEPASAEWKINNHPRESVSWYDAMAFCRWLSYQLGGGYDIDRIDEWLVRLPTEVEWEKAARGTDGRMYPWGDEFDASKCNMYDSGFGKTTPVTRYPQGASPCGALDMAGNVKEWCLTAHKNPALTAAGEDIRVDVERELRGGGWNARFEDSVRVFFRWGDFPAFHDTEHGFRICRPGSYIHNLR